MNKIIRRKYVFNIVVISLLIICSFINIKPVVFADSSYSPSNYYPISDKVQEGSIISFVKGKYKLSTVPYDQYIVGTVTSNPAITQDISGPIPFRPVINAGGGYVLVSTINGPIKKGDYITSSTIPGVGQKAIKAGYTIGAAESDFTATNTKTIGKIPISINIHYFIGNVQVSSKLLDILSLSTLATYESPSLVMKYVVAAAIVALSLLFTLILITRTANKGIDALGRNPLSSFDIHVGMALNIFIAVMILLVGFTTGFFVLRL